MGTFQQYAIGAGSNVALNSLTNIETISVNGVKFSVVKARGLYDPGIQRIAGNGSYYFAGYTSVGWLFDVMTFPQLNYLRTTYCAGGWSGQVTIYTTLGSDSYYRMNATLLLPKVSDNDGRFFALKNYIAQMTRLATAS